MLADLIRISDEALTEALSSAPDNGCAYLEKKGKTSQIFLSPIFHLFCLRAEQEGSVFPRLHVHQEVQPEPGPAARGEDSARQDSQPLRQLHTVHRAFLQPGEAVQVIILSCHWL